MRSAKVPLKDDAKVPLKMGTMRSAKVQAGSKSGCAEASTSSYS